MTYLVELEEGGGEKLEDAAKKLMTKLVFIKQSDTLTEEMLQKMTTNFKDQVLKDGTSLNNEEVHQDPDMILNELCALDVEELQQHKHYSAMTPLAEQVCEGAAKKLKTALGIIKQSDTLKEKLLHLMETQLKDDASFSAEEDFKTMRDMLFDLEVEGLQQHEHFIALTSLAKQARLRFRDKAYIALMSGLYLIAHEILALCVGLCAFLVLIPAAAIVWLVSVLLVGVVHALYTYIAGLSEDIMNLFFSKADMKRHMPWRLVKVAKVSKKRQGQDPKEFLDATATIIVSSSRQIPFSIRSAYLLTVL